MPRNMKNFPVDSIRHVGSIVGDIQKQTDHLKSKGGLLPQVDRTRGPMNQNHSHDVQFKVLDANRKVMLSLNFYPVERQYIQGAHGFWQNGDLNIWNATFKKKTVPGRLLFAIVATQGSIFEHSGDTMKPPVFCFPNTHTPDTDWNIIAHKTAPVGNPFVASVTMAWRFVREDERTFTPTTVVGGRNPPNTANNGTGTWLWEIEHVSPPKVAETFTAQGVGNFDKISLGSDKRGPIVAAAVFPSFDRNTFPLLTTTDEKGKMIEVEKGIATATAPGRSGGPQTVLDDNVYWGAFGGEYNPSVVDGDWWQEDWGKDIDITHISFINLFPWVLYHPANPPIQIIINDIYPSGQGVWTFDIPATGNYVTYGLDFEQPITVSGSAGGTLKVVFKGNSVDYSFDGGHDSGYNEIIAWYKDPRLGTNLQTQAADIFNNPIPYHGQFSEGKNKHYPPDVYIGQRSNIAPECEISIDLTGGVINGPPWNYAGASVVIPGLTKALPHIPFPYADIQFNDSIYPHGPDMHYLASGTGVNMTADLYASGVRVYIDGEDISQFIFGGPSGVIDEVNNRWDNIDISHWVKVPGQHKIVITTDEGEADVDTRFEVY